MTATAINKVGSVSSGPAQRKRGLTRQALERMWLPRRFWAADMMKACEVPEVDRYLSQISKAIRRGYGMLLCGENGVGKTATACVILREARRAGATGLFITAEQFMTDAIDKIRYDDAHTVAQRCRLVDMLVIDDLGKETVNFASSRDGAESMIEGLLRHRSANMRSTIITTNLGPKQVEGRYGRSLTRMLQESTPVITMVGPSLREAGVKSLFEFFKG